MARSRSGGVWLFILALLVVPYVLRIWGQGAHPVRVTSVPARSSAVQSGRQISPANQVPLSAKSTNPVPGNTGMFKVVPERPGGLLFSIILGVVALLTGIGFLIKFLAASGSRRTQKLAQAVSAGDSAKVQSILRKNRVVDFRNPDTNMWLIHEAVRKHQAAILEALLAKGANPDQLDREGNSALILAAEAGFGEGIRLLLQYRADVNRRNQKGRTALIAASINGNATVVELLLAAGADPNLPGQEVPPLISATYNGHLEIVRLLLEKGADINAQNGYGITALIWAAEKGFFDIVTILLERGADVHQKPAQSGTALMQAAGFGHYDITALLLDRGDDLNEGDCDGQTPLIRAAHFGHADVVRLFIARGAKKRQTSNNQWNAVMYALKEGYAGIAEMLLEGEPDEYLESVDFKLYKEIRDAETAVLTLAKVNHPKSVEVLCRLLEKKADARWAVARALGEIGDEQATQALLAAFENESGEGRNRLLEIIRPIPDPRIEQRVREQDELNKIEREKQLIHDTEKYLSQLSNYHTISKRQQAARELIRLYESGELPDGAKVKIIAARTAMETPHQDRQVRESHTDRVGFHQDLLVPSNDCSDSFIVNEFTPNPAGRHQDNTHYRHADEGIGITFPEPREVT